MHGNITIIIFKLDEMKKVDAVRHKEHKNKREQTTVP